MKTKYLLIPDISMYGCQARQLKHRTLLCRIKRNASVQSSFQLDQPSLIYSTVAFTKSEADIFSRHLNKVL